MSRLREGDGGFGLGRSERSLGRGIGMYSATLDRGPLGVVENVEIRERTASRTLPTKARHSAVRYSLPPA